MGTTLTGTTPQDTYDSLIKVTDNGPLGASLKTLTDGNGNDSALALSTGAASVTGTLAVSGNATFDTNTLFVDATNNRVGVGTTSPATALDVNGGVKVGGSLSGFSGAEVLLNAGADAQVAISTNGTGSTEMYFDQRGTGTAIWRFRDTTATRMSIVEGNVGIGTSAPSTRLTIDNAATVTTRAIDMVGNSSTAKGHLGYFADAVYLSSNYFFESGQNNDVSGLGQALIVVQASAGSASKINFNTSAAGSTTTTQRASIDADGLKFGADTAAANALDDYEEGTFTATLAPSGSGTITLTAGQQTCKYTKIGNKVSITGYLVVSSVSSPIGSQVNIQGLPFTVANSSSSSGSSNTVFFDAPAYTPSIEPSIFLANGTRIDVLKNAMLIGAADELYISATYFV